MLQANTHAFGQTIHPCLLGEWIVVAATFNFEDSTQVVTKVDLQTLIINKTQHGYHAAFANKSASPYPLYLQERYGFIWLSIDSPKKPLFHLAEFDHPQARIVPCGTYGVNTSPLRAVENFLDMAHFPYVHTNILGAEPLTEVKPYRVHVDENDEIWATDCIFTQPFAAPNSTEPQQTQYKYRVLSPMNVLLYKINTQGSGVIPADVVCLFIQPIHETQIRAHLLMILDDQHSQMTDMILFQQKIFSQDKPILENHLPLKLPIYQKIEIPTRADLTATIYRKWLAEKEWLYGAELPEEAIAS